MERAMEGKADWRHWLGAIAALALIIWVGNLLLEVAWPAFRDLAAEGLARYRIWSARPANQGDALQLAVSVWILAAVFRGGRSGEKAPAAKSEPRYDRLGKRIPD